MTRDAARARLRRMTDGEPELTDGDIEELLDLAARADTYGRLPTDTGWIGAYDLNAAAAEAFLWKAARSAGEFDFSADGASFAKGSRAANLAKQASEFESRSSSDSGQGTIFVRSSLDPGYDRRSIANL